MQSTENVSKPIKASTLNLNVMLNVLMKYIIIVNELYREYYGVDTPIRLSLLHTKLKSI